MSRAARSALVLPVLACIGLTGCMNVGGKVTGTSRSGTEQLLLTGAADRAIACIDFGPLAGTRVSLDESRIAAVDKDWLCFSLRRAMASRGVLLVDKADAPQVIVEAGVAAYATDERDVSFSLPGISLVGTLPVPITSGPGGQTMSRNGKQSAVVKLALFGYDVQTRRMVWESGTILNDEYLTRHAVLGSHVRRRSSLPELERYPPNWSWRSRPPKQR